MKVLLKQLLMQVHIIPVSAASGHHMLFSSRDEHSHGAIVCVKMTVGTSLHPVKVNIL